MSNARKTYPDIDGFRPGEGFRWDTSTTLTKQVNACISLRFGSTMNPSQAPIVGKILSELPIYPEYRRKENIGKINNTQCKDIEHSIVTGLTIPKEFLKHTDNRRLVLYYRGSQTDNHSAKQIQELLEFIRAYIEGGYSSVFDVVAIVYRRGYELIGNLHEISYSAKGDIFKILSSIYGNTVHFTDGTPDVVPGTIPIISRSVGNRWRYQGKGNLVATRILDNSLEFPLEYNEKFNTRYGNSENNPNYEAQCHILLKAIQECERKMLEYGGCRSMSEK